LIKKLAAIWERWVSGVFRTFAGWFQKEKLNLVFDFEKSSFACFVAPNIMPKDKVFDCVRLKTKSLFSKNKTEVKQPA